MNYALQLFITLNLTTSPPSLRATRQTSAVYPRQQMNWTWFTLSCLLSYSSTPDSHFVVVFLGIRDYLSVSTAAHWACVPYNTLSWNFHFHCLSVAWDYYLSCSHLVKWNLIMMKIVASCSCAGRRARLHRHLFGSWDCTQCQWWLPYLWSGPDSPSSRWRSIDLFMKRDCCQKRQLHPGYFAACYLWFDLNFDYWRRFIFQILGWSDLNQTIYYSMATFCQCGYCYFIPSMHWSLLSCSSSLHANYSSIFGRHLPQHNLNLYQFHFLRFGQIGNLTFLHDDGFQEIFLSIWQHFHMFVIVDLAWFIVFEGQYQVIGYMKYLMLSLYWSCGWEA